MNGDDRFIPADAAGSQLGSGVDPASGALMQALSQIRAAQAQPLIPDNPLAQLGAGLQGIAAGYRGEVNPAVKQALAVREQQLQGGLGQAHLGLGIAGLGIRAASEQRLEQHERTKTTLDMSKTLMASDNPDHQKLGARFFASAMRQIGVNVPPEALADLGGKPLKKEEINAIASDLLGGMPPATAATLYKRDPRTIALIGAIPDDPTWRAAIGLKSIDALKSDITEAQTKKFAMLKAERDYLSPEVTKEVLAQAKMAFPTQQYYDLEPEQKAEMVKRAENAVLARQKGLVDYNRDALLDKPLPPNQKAAFVDPRTYRSPSGVLTQRSADANGLVMIEDQATRRALPAVRTLDETVQRVRDIVQRHPEYWPPTQLGPDGSPNLIANQVAVQIGRTKMAANQGVDPDLATLKASMADIPRLATTAGVGSRFSTYLAQIEKEAAGWDTAGTRESKLTQFQTTRARLNSQVTALGLQPLPTLTYVTLPDGRRGPVPGGE